MVQDAIGNRNYRTLVAEVTGCTDLAGVVVSQVVADEVQVMMLATDATFRRRGVATDLMRSLMRTVSGCVERARDCAAGNGLLQLFSTVQKVTTVLADMNINMCLR